MINQTDRSPLFCDITLAGRIEQAEAQFIAACSAAARRRNPAGFATAIAGGVASYAEPDSPLNKVAGLGFAGLPDPAEFDAGCDVAVITVQPGSQSQQNAQRRGFDLLYTRAVVALNRQP